LGLKSLRAFNFYLNDIFTRDKFKFLQLSSLPSLKFLSLNILTSEALQIIEFEQFERIMSLTPSQKSIGFLDLAVIINESKLLKGYTEES